MYSKFMSYLNKLNDSLKNSPTHHRFVNKSWKIGSFNDKYKPVNMRSIIRLNNIIGRQEKALYE